MMKSLGQSDNVCDQQSGNKFSTDSRAGPGQCVPATFSRPSCTEQKHRSDVTVHICIPRFTSPADSRVMYPSFTFRFHSFQDTAAFLFLKILHTFYILQAVFCSSPLHKFSHLDRNVRLRQLLQQLHFCKSCKLMKNFSNSQMFISLKIIRCLISYHLICYKGNQTWLKKVLTRFGYPYYRSVCASLCDINRQAQIM